MVGRHCITPEPLLHVLTAGQATLDQAFYGKIYLSIITCITDYKSIFVAFLSKLEAQRWKQAR